MVCIKCGAELPDGSAFCNICGKRQALSDRTPRRRGNGQGSVFRLSNGKWRAQKVIRRELVPGSDPVRYKNVYATRSDFKRKVDALEYLRILGTAEDKRETKYAEKEAPAAEKTDITLRALYDLWEPTHQKSKSTMNCYAAGFKLFEDCWDVSMKNQDIDELQACLDNSDKGKRTKENARAALGLVYKYGMPRGYVPDNVAGRPNLAEFLRIGEHNKRHKSGLSMADLEKLRGSCGMVPYAEYVYCHCYLGFRPSAFIALRVEDYNRQERAFVGGIKTDAGIDRTVTVSPKIQAIVDKAINGRETGAVFCNLQTGNPLSIKEYRAIFYDVLDACGIENQKEEHNGQLLHALTPHSCRHTFATLMKRIDAPEKDKMSLIGHASPEMLRHYQDVNYDELRKITDAL